MIQISLVKQFSFKNRIHFSTIKIGYISHLSFSPRLLGGGRRPCRCLRLLSRFSRCFRDEDGGVATLNRLFRALIDQMVGRPAKPRSLWLLRVPDGYSRALYHNMLSDSFPQLHYGMYGPFNDARLAIALTVRRKNSAVSTSCALTVFAIRFETDQILMQRLFLYPFGSISALST